MKNIKTALVVGGGIGGMAAAIRLKEEDIAVDLIDLDPEWRVYGAGITITGPTLRAYRRLGLLEEIKAHGATTPGGTILRFDGVRLHDLDEPVLEKGLPAAGGIMRPVLHRLMQDRVHGLSIPVRLGVTVSELENSNEGVDVRFSDGAQGRYDLVVGADSIYSRVREIAFPYMAPAKPTGQGCWRVSMRKPPTFDRGEFYFGHRLPAGISPCGPDSIYLWMLTPDTGEFFEDADLYHQMRENLVDFGGNAGWVRDNMRPDDFINYRPLSAALQPRSWSNGRIVLIGDAVHATTPHLASGAGMAVESALVLVEELAKAGDVAEGLSAYETRRYERCRDVVETSIAVGHLQLEGGSPEVVGEKIGKALHRLAEPF